MNKILSILNLLTLLVLTACSSKEHNQSISESKIEDKKMDFTTSVIKEDKNISIKNIQLNPGKKQDDINGLSVVFDVEIKPEAFQQIKKEEYSGFFVDIKFSSQDGQTQYYRDEVFKANEKKKFINSNRDNFISSFGGRTIEVFFPYRQMALSAGSHDVQIEIAAFPVKYEENNSSLNMKLMKGFANQAAAATELNFKLQTPELYQATFTVLKAKLDPQLKNPSKYDVALSGKGYPDLFWEVFCGNDYIYYSPVEKNVTQYLKKYSSPAFTFTKDDVISLAVVDYDNGPFNTQDDIVGMQKFKASELTNSIDTLQFGKLEFIILQTSIEKFK